MNKEKSLTIDKSITDEWESLSSKRWSVRAINTKTDKFVYFEDELRAAVLWAMEEIHVLLRTGIRDADERIWVEGKIREKFKDEIFGRELCE